MANISTTVKTVSIVGTLIVVFVLTLMIGLPQYKVWQQGLAGEAALAKATQERLIQIEQAKAELESSRFRPCRNSNNLSYAWDDHRCFYERTWKRGKYRKQWMVNL